MVINLQLGTCRTSFWFCIVMWPVVLHIYIFPDCNAMQVSFLWCSVMLYFLCKHHIQGSAGYILQEGQFQQKWVTVVFLFHLLPLLLFCLLVLQFLVNLASSKIVFHSSRSCDLRLHFLTPMFLCYLNKVPQTNTSVQRQHVPHSNS